MEYFLGFIIIFIAVIFITRLFGAWMLRINDVISELKGVREEIQLLRMDVARETDSTASVDFEEESIGNNSYGKLDSDEFKELKSKLKAGDLIVEDKESGGLYIMSDKQHTKDVGLNQTEKYTVIFRN